ncbi:hypothetical protein TKK_0002983 [Trichogramma kaykai]
MVNLEESSQTSSESEVANAILSLRGVLNQNVQVINQARAAQPQHVIMPNTQSIIRNFHGTEDSENSDAWIRELDTLKNIHHWTDAVAFNVAKAHFKDAAFKWYLTRIETIIDYQTMGQAFRSTFTKRLSKSDKLRAMNKRIQKKDEALQEYVFEKIWLCSGLELDVSEMRDEVAY